MDWEKALFVVLGAALVTVSNYLKDCWTRRDKRAAELRDAYAQWGACELKTIRLKRWIDRAQDARYQTPEGEEGLDLHQFLRDTESARHATDIAYLVLLQLDPNVIDAVNEITLAIHEGDYDTAAHRVNQVMVRRIKRLGKISEIRMPGTEKTQSA